MTFMSRGGAIHNDSCLVPRQGESTPAIRGHLQQYPDEGSTRVAAAVGAASRQTPLLTFCFSRSGTAEGIFSTKDL